MTQEKRREESAGPEGEICNIWRERGTHGLKCLKHSTFPGQFESPYYPRQAVVENKNKKLAQK